MKNKDKLSNSMMNDAAKALIVQKDLLNKSEQNLQYIHEDLDQLTDLNNQHNDALDMLLQQAKSMLNQENTSFIKNTTVSFNSIEERIYNQIETIEVKEEQDWQSFNSSMDEYLTRNNIHVAKDPFDNLLTDIEKIELAKRIQLDYKVKSANCDKYDYLIAAFSGLATGLIDAFFVGTPMDSKLGRWTDKQTDNVVIKFAKMVWSHDKNNGSNLKKVPDSIGSAIGFLERRFKVNYDARFMKDLHTEGQDFQMSPSNHHLKSLGHSPDIIGLFFSILDQFTGKASFISDGKIIRMEPIEGTNKFELVGGNFIAKIFAGIANWFGHLLSDVAGSSGTRGHNDGRRGAGIPIPFFELFQLFDFGSIPVEEKSFTIAQFSTKVFESGYDARFGATMAIPVTINELCIRLLWALKSKFYHKRSLKESLPVGNKPELRRMLLVGHGTLCLVDGVDAAIRSQSNLLLFALRLNSVAWSRFAMAGFVEIRRIYNKNAIDLVAMERDVQVEWSRLFEMK
ncbi:hypothetical protein V7138_12905 [Bacillus sp. JJ1533]|uniref:hypothetical protein n=1 Tax=Bacillus sp. JJ1533 TaxID=3122959 RepID=UPI002FFD761F